MILWYSVELESSLIFKWPFKPLKMNKSSLAFLLIFLSINLCYSQIIINHTNTNITSLTEAEIVDAKQILHIAYGHTSHGSQVTDGMTSLVTFANNGGKGMNYSYNIFR